MGWRGKRAGAAVLLLAVLTLGVWACGGKDSASEHAKSADVATTAATGPKGSTGVTGPSGTTGAKRAKQSGGSSPPSTPTAQAPTPTAPSTNTNKPGHKRSSKKKRGPAYDPDNPTSGELAGLYSEAR